MEHGNYIECCTANIDAGVVVCIKNVQVLCLWELQEMGLTEEMGFILEVYCKRNRVK
jgi:hypothetical protein